MDLVQDVVAMALLGGVLIGLSLGVLTLFTGRIMSGSAMIGSLLGGAEGVAATSIAFIGGIVSAALILGALGFAPLPSEETNLALLGVGGLLVGASARGSGASLGGVMTGIARRAPHAIVMLLVILTGATLGGIFQVILERGTGA